MRLALCVLGLQVGCLHEASEICGSGGVCPPGLRCADTGDTRTCILLTCGNGQVDPGEACDDGNTRSGDGCPADCTPPCGDGVLDPSEACDDGNTLDGDGCSADCSTLDSIFLVSPSLVKFMATEGDALPESATVTVHLEYRGDAVLAGYAPGVPQPTWLSFATAPSTANTVDYNLQVTDTSTVGERSTSVRFVISHLNSTGLDTFDLPVAYSVAPSDLAVEATPATLAFTAPAGGVAPPSQAVSVAFNGTSITVTSAPPWVSVSAPPATAKSPVSLAVSVNNTAFPAGTTLSGDITLGTTRGTFQRTTTLHVDYKLLAFVPEVRFVAPYLGIAGRGGTVHVRGRGFQASGLPVSVGIGDRVIGPMLPDSDTQITLSYPPLPEGRYPVTLSNPPGIAPTAPELVIVTPLPITYQAIDAPSPRTRIVYDAERQAIYGVNRLDQQIEHFVYVSSTWSKLSPHVIPQLTDIAMVPNGRSLIVLDRDAINEISLTDGLFAPVKRAGNPDPFCGGFFHQAAAADNGKIYVVFDLSECSGFTSSYLYDVLDRSLSTHSLLYNGLIGASGDGSRIYAGSNGVSPAQTVEIFVSLSNTTVSSTTDFNLTAVSASGDASRVILENRYVYSRSLTLIGNVPLHGVALTSRDSSRAFVYVVDAMGARLEVYDLNGPLQSGALYPLLKTVMLPDSANSPSGFHAPVTMTSSLDDGVVFVSGDSKLLVVPVN